MYNNEVGKENESYQRLGSVVTKDTAASYLTRLAKVIYDGLDIGSALVFGEQAERIVSAGFLTWEQVEEIEINAII